MNLLKVIAKNDFIYTRLLLNFTSIKSYFVVRLCVYEHFSRCKSMHLWTPQSLLKQRVYESLNNPFVVKTTRLRTPPAVAKTDTRAHYTSHHSENFIGLNRRRSRWKLIEVNPTKGGPLLNVCVWERESYRSLLNIDFMQRVGLIYTLEFRLSHWSVA